GDPRFGTNAQRVKQRGILVPMIEATMRSQTCAVWQQRLRDADVPYAPVLDYPQLFSLDQVAARGLKVSVRDVDGKNVELVGSPFHVQGATLPPPSMPPRLGQHTEEILREVLGLDAEQIEALRQKKAI